MVDAQAQDWGLIDESNITGLKNDIPMFRGRREEYSRLNSVLGTLLQMKTFATENQVRVPGLPRLLELYSIAVDQGKHIRKQSWWKRIRKMRDFDGSQEEFKENCEAIWILAHQTSLIVHKDAEKSKARIARESIQRRRSLDGLVDQAEPDLVQRHNQHGDTAMRSTPPNTGVVAQSSSITTNTLSEETIRNIAEMSAAKTLERFILHGRPPGGILQSVNHFHGCIVSPSRGAAPTVNFGGRNNRGAAMNTYPTEVWSGADDIDGTSDDESHYDTATDATRSGSERHSGSAISLGAQSMQSPAGASRSPSGIW
ncbi:uncharacterized protein F5891DRAFT_1025986 [Suillus fuscotomentosus]|uniref:Uncharacterized protein n=1 Tax=Suillus fuscotomentosus TaxID=1912939 RepID=A0AAD4HLB4_9AGAM|nr:uncharacterized protein F5891DRAFT_1025986 [Suillus fuscotomentosus]KAG1901890.1 hypothetical protein F5891DRAFT_1025986 [Suillus fuscotomentosus]